MILINWETPRKSDAIALDLMSIHFEKKNTQMRKSLVLSKDINYGYWTEACISKKMTWISHFIRHQIEIQVLKTFLFSVIRVYERYYVFLAHSRVPVFLWGSCSVVHMFRWSSLFWKSVFCCWSNSLRLRFKISSLIINRI